MADKTSYIRLDRNIKNWRWWKDHKTLVVFLTLLIDANIAEHGFSGQIIRRGQVVTSLPSLCNSTGLTIREVRTAISHLKMTGEVTDKTFPKFRVITIVNYDKYQDLTGKTTYKTPVKRQSNDRQATALREYREIENGEKNIPPKSPTGGLPPSGYPYPCGRFDKPDWMTDDEWLINRDLTADDIPGSYRGEYDSVLDYLQDKKKGVIK